MVSYLNTVPTHCCNEFLLDKALKKESERLAENSCVQIYAIPIVLSSLLHLFIME